MCIRDRKRSHKKIDQNTENNDTKTEILDSEPVSYTHLDVYKRQEQTEM